MPREFTTVGVVGLGTMGAGIAEVMARNGIKVIGVEVDDAAPGPRPRPPAGLHARAVKRGKLTDAEAAELIDRITFSTSLDDLAAAELVVEAVPEHLALKREVFQPAGRDLSARDGPGHQHLVAVGDRDLGGHRRPARVVGVHFFNPAPVMKLVEVVRTVVTDPEVVDDVEALVRPARQGRRHLGDRAGFIANALLFGYLNHAVSMYEHALRHPRGHRRRHAAGLRPAHGPAGAAGPDRASTPPTRSSTRCTSRARDRLHAPAPILKQMVDRRACSAARPAAASTAMRARLPGRGRRRADPGRRRRPARRQARPVRPSASSARARWPPASSRSSPRPGTTSRCVARGHGQGGGRPRGDRALAGEGGAARQAHRERPGRGAGPPAPAPSTLDELADADLVIEAVVEDLEVKRALFANLDELCKPGAMLATTTSSLPVIECAMATQRPADVVGMHFFNPAPVMKLVEVVRTVTTADDVVATVHAVCAKLGKTRCDCGDRAGFIVNALLFPYLNDAVKMLEAHYATSRGHRHRDEGRLRLPDGPVRAAGRGGPGRVAGHPAGAVPGVPRARLRAGAAAGTPGDRGIPGTQGGSRVPGLRVPLAETVPSGAVTGWPNAGRGLITLEV